MLLWLVVGCAPRPVVFGTPEVFGDGDLSVVLEIDGDTVVPVVSGSGTLRAVTVDAATEIDGDQPLRWWRQGYQSWSWSGVVDPPPLSRGADGLPDGSGDGAGIDIAAEDPASSWWAGLLGRPDGEAVLLGALDAETTKVRVTTEDGGISVLWGGRGEQVPVDGEVRLDPVRAFVGDDPWVLWTRYADAVVETRGTGLPDGSPPAGWASWTVQYSAVTEADIRAEIGPTAADFPGGVLQIDDGWEREWGDWQADDGFPSGMAGIAAEIRAAGLTPGLWMAPLYVSRRSPIYAEHPDWWVKSADGTEKAFTNFGANDLVILDVTHPDAAAWLQGQIRGRVEDGFTYLKLDFLYAGAEEGERSQPMTGVQAYALATSLIRDAAPDAFILACGAPMLPSVGWAQGFRSGADIAFEIAPSADPAFVRWQARNTAARGWAGGRWWFTDPDQVMLEAPLSDGEARLSAFGAAVSGGTWLLGDAAARPRRALGVQMAGSRGIIGVPRDPLSFVSGLDAGPLAERAQPDDRVPTTWDLPGGGVAVLNFGAAPIEVDAPAGSDIVGDHPGGILTVPQADGRYLR